MFSSISSLQSLQLLCTLSAHFLLSFIPPGLCSFQIACVVCFDFFKNIFIFKFSNARTPSIVTLLESYECFHREILIFLLFSILRKPKKFWLFSFYVCPRMLINSGFADPSSLPFCSSRKGFITTALSQSISLYPAAFCPSIIRPLPSFPFLLNFWTSALPSLSLFVARLHHSFDTTHLSPLHHLFHFILKLLAHQISTARSLHSPFPCVLCCSSPLSSFLSLGPTGFYIIFNFLLWPVDNSLSFSCFLVLLTNHLISSSRLFLQFLVFTRVMPLCLSSLWTLFEMINSSDGKSFSRVQTQQQRQLQCTSALLLPRNVRSSRYNNSIMKLN